MERQVLKLPSIIGVPQLLQKCCMLSDFLFHSFLISPLMSLSGRAIARSPMRQSIQAILLEKSWSCIYY